jgi:hypothetical protein
MTTKRKFVTSFAFSVGVLTAIVAMPAAHAEMGARGAELVTNGPQFNPGDRSGSWSAQRNVRDSHRYEALVQSNPRFRNNRMHRECGPIGDRQLRGDCAATFGHGSSLPSWGHRDFR